MVVEAECSLLVALASIIGNSPMHSASK